MNDYNLQELIDAWRELENHVKDRMKEFRDSLLEDQLAINMLEEKIISLIKKQGKGVTSFTLKGDEVPDYARGTAYISKPVRSKVEDTEAFFGYVLESGLTELLFARAADKAVEAYVEEHKQPPPGIVIQRVEKLNFRKAS